MHFHYFRFFMSLANLFSTSASNAKIFFNFYFCVLECYCSSPSILIYSIFFTLFSVFMSTSTPTISSVKITPNVLRFIQGASGLGYTELMAIYSITLVSMSNFI